ncbi:serine/threonine-protein kinase [Ilumatobacter sp.]|uniref:serine/threonine-protein kinase n=1 Tax=Ilumatobacter sp. TaxID=1967498 RepID=UPI003B527AE2
MPLQGEATARRTYVNLERVLDGSQLVHRCEHAILGKRCAQKTVRLSGTSVAAFEPWLLEELDHPRITPVREVQFDPQYEGHVTFVMPWYEGGSVARALIEGPPFSLAGSLSIMSDLLGALEYLHTVKRYVHRDVKTDNVLLDGGRTTGFLSDFGLAAAIESSGDAPAVLSTYEYMAPECASDLRHAPQADVYSAGMVLFELLSGRIRWEDLDRADVERRVTEGRRALPDSAYSASAFSPHVPDRLVRIVRKAIAAEMDRRYQTAAEFLRALNQVVSIDWHETEPETGEMCWLGTWPPQSRDDNRDEYRVTVRTMTKGPSSGLQRLVAHHRRPGGAAWRRAIPDRDVAVDDSTGLRTFFADVAASASHRRAAR